MEQGEMLDDHDGDWWLRSLKSSSEMGELVAQFDWASTPLGEPATWSSSLRAVVRVCLTTRFPMLVLWGPDLVKIYNDGYRQMLGSQKHPRALGAPAREIWPEVWDVIGPLFDEVVGTGKPTWSEHQLLVLHRDGFPEECWFTFSYSPIVDDDGSIGGVLDTCTETTRQVVNERRLACLGDVAASLVSGMHVTDVCVRAATALSRWTADIPSAELYLRAGDDWVLAAASRRHALSSTGDAPLLRRVVESGEPALLDADPLPGRPAERYAIPIGGASPTGLLVVGLNHLRPFDDAYRSFVELCAHSIGAALESAIKRAAELGEQRRISRTLQEAMLSPASDLPTVAARYVPAVGRLSVGGDWYDVVDLGDGRWALVVGDCVGHDLEAAAVMGQLRSASRALLLEDHGPGAMLEAMDRFAASIEASCTTMLCAVVDLGLQKVTYSAAGHPPALLVGASGTCWLDGALGPPLDVVDEQRHEAVAGIADGDLLVLYSDGLVERRGEDIDVGLERLRAAAEARWGSSVKQLADELLGQLVTDAAADDVVLVVQRVHTDGQS